MKRKTITLNPDSLRQRVLRLIEIDGEQTVNSLQEKLNVTRREIQNALSGLRNVGKIERVGEGRYRLAQKRKYAAPPEGRIDIAGPPYARGYRWDVSLF